LDYNLVIRARVKREVRAKRKSVLAYASATAPSSSPPVALFSR